MSARLANLVADFGWLGASSEASCLSVVVGRGVEETAAAFGVDLATAVDANDDQWAGQRLAAVVPVAAHDAGDQSVSIVLEDNGFEGSRAVVLGAASRAGKAASIFWNVNGVVVFACARRGKVLWSGELGMDEDLDGLPRSLIRLANMADDDPVDRVAVGAAMVTTFTGTHVRGSWLADVQWSVVSPHVEQPPQLTAETSLLQWDHPDLVSALLLVDPQDRRSFVRAVVRAATHQASLATDESVAPVLDSVAVDGPGVISLGFETWERQRSQDSERLWAARDAALNRGEEAPLPEEEQRVSRANWIARALRYASHDDDLSALLGAVEAAVHVYELDGHKDLAVSAFTAAAIGQTRQFSSALHALPTSPTPEDRDQALEQQRLERQQAELNAELAHEAMFWGGKPPSTRMRESAGAYALAQRDRDLLDLLDPLPDSLLRDITDWAVRRVLSDAGLWELPWVQDAARGEPQLQALFDRLFTDPSVRHTDFVNDEGDQVSRQAMALPALAAYNCTDPFDAACTALSPAGDGPQSEAQALYDDVRRRFSLS